MTLTFTDEEANAIIAGLQKLVQEAGLQNPSLYQMAHGIMVKFQEDAKTRAEAKAAEADQDEKPTKKAKK